ncbi:MAG: SpoIIE family protein phosphatase [Anaerolineales bacterium]|nr:SpoIIE family protein phosphatase [Anaerolineales bacterium]
MTDRVALSKLPLFASFQTAELDALATCMRPVVLPEGDDLFSEGDPGDCFYVILDGSLDIIKAIGTSEERILHTRRAGDFLGEMSMFNPDGLRTASARARSLARLLQLSHAEFQNLLQRHPALAYQVIRDLSLRMHQSDNATIEELRHKNQQLTQAYDELKAAQAQIIEKEKLERELQVARNIQLSMLPAELPVLQGYQFGAYILPARAVGGDLYDFIPLNEEQVGVVIGDVSDKGVPAALFMALSRAVIRSEASSAATPAQVLQRVNQRLVEMNRIGQFITLIYGILDCAQGAFSYARAGHEIPLHYDAQGEKLPVHVDEGMLLGVFDPIKLDTQTICMPPGSTLFLFTDGAIDAINADSERFGYDKLQSTLQYSLSQSPQGICDSISHAIQAYHGDTPQADDITLVAIQRKDR